jgi:hypothetical protein
MSDLIKITKRHIGNEELQTTNLRDLWKFLELK